jgi:hypothetical protein
MGWRRNLAFAMYGLLRPTDFVAFVNLWMDYLRSLMTTKWIFKKKL